MGVGLSKLVGFCKSQFWPLPYPEGDLSGQIIVVTGANTGLGLEAARHFVRLQAARVILACRNVEKGEKARQDMEMTTGRVGVVEVWPLDLASFESVGHFARRVQGLPRLDVLVENAGIAVNRFVKAEQWESTITVNVLSTAYLALLLLPKLEESARRHDVRPHLVVVSSLAHHLARFKERSEPNLFEYYKSSSDMGDRYAASKLLEVFFVRELARQLEASGANDVVVNVLCPGFCRSEIFRSMPFLISVAIKVCVFFFARTTEMGSRALVAAAVSGKETHGQFMNDAKVVKPSQYVVSSEGFEMQKRVYRELTDLLETIEPGISKKVTE